MVQELSRRDFQISFIKELGLMSLYFVYACTFEVVVVPKCGSVKEYNIVVREEPAHLYFGNDV